MYTEKSERLQIIRSWLGVHDVWSYRPKGCNNVVMTAKPHWYGQSQEQLPSLVTLVQSSCAVSPVAEGSREKNEKERPLPWEKQMLQQMQAAREKKEEERRAALKKEEVSRRLLQVQPAEEMRAEQEKREKDTEDKVNTGLSGGSKSTAKPKPSSAAPKPKPAGPEFPVKPVNPVTPNPSTPANSGASGAPKGVIPVHPATPVVASAESKHDRHGSRILDPHEDTQRQSLLPETVSEDPLESSSLAQKTPAEVTPSKTLPEPIFSKEWQAAFLLFSAGGKLQMPDSDVILDVPKDAVDEDSRDEMHMAVSIDLDHVATVLGIQAKEQICSVPVDFWVSEGFRFRKHVQVISPHFLPEDFDPSLVRVYCVRRGSNGEVLVTRVRQQDSQNLQDSLTPLARFSGRHTQLDTHLKPQHSPEGDSHLTSSDPPKMTSTNVPWDRTIFFQISSGHVIVSTDHFSAYVCAYGHVGPPVLNVLASGCLTQRVRDQQTADVSVHIWDGRLFIKDFRQEYNLIDLSDILDRKLLNVLPSCSDSRLVMSISIISTSVRDWRHCEGADGHPAMPPLQETDLSSLLTSCNHDGCDHSSRNTGPISASWMLETQPGGNPETCLQCAIVVSQVARDATRLWSRRKGVESHTRLRVKLPKQRSQTESWAQTDYSFPLSASSPVPVGGSQAVAELSPGTPLQHVRNSKTRPGISAASNCGKLRNGAGSQTGARPKYNPGFRNHRQNGARSIYRQRARAQNMAVTSRGQNRTDDTELKQRRGKDSKAQRSGPAVKGTLALSGPPGNTLRSLGALNLNDTAFPPPLAGARSVNYYVKVNGSATFNSRAKKTRRDAGRQYVAFPELMDDETLEENGDDDSRVSVESQYETRGQPEENPLQYEANAQPAVVENGRERQAYVSDSRNPVCPPTI